MISARPVIVVVFLSYAIFPPSMQAAEITVERSEHGATVKIDGQLFTEYLIRSGTKPILWPIIGPTGKAVTRAYPMEKHTKEASDHVHHRSLWFTHGEVNGIDFWGEVPKGKTGAVVHRRFAKIASGNRAEIVTESDWMSPTGKKVCEDERHLTFGTQGDARWIDFDIAVHASEGPLSFGDTKEGSFGLRMADTIRVDSKKGGKIVNSLGQTNAAAWAQHADWVDYHGPLDGETVGIAIFDHPSSFRHPTGWHVRTYGLFAANPFAVQAFAEKSDKPHPYTLPKGEKLVLRYRVLLHRGDEKQAKVAEAYADYAKEAKE
jgi:hypothetical protein